MALGLVANIQRLQRQNNQPDWPHFFSGLVLKEQMNSAFLLQRHPQHSQMLHYQSVCLVGEQRHHELLTIGHAQLTGQYDWKAL